MPIIACGYYIEILHKITNRNAITFVRYLAQTKTVIHMPVIGTQMAYRVKITAFRWYRSVTLIVSATYVILIVSATTCSYFSVI